MCLLTIVVAAAPVCGAKRLAMRGSSSGVCAGAGTNARDDDDDDDRIMGSVSSPAAARVVLPRAEKPTPLSRLRAR